MIQGLKQHSVDSEPTWLFVFQL